MQTVIPFLKVNQSQVYDTFVMIQYLLLENECVFLNIGLNQSPVRLVHLFYPRDVEGQTLSQDYSDTWKLLQMASVPHLGEVLPKSLPSLIASG